MKRGEVVSLEIRDLTEFGQGVGTAGGFALFVDGALPGERVRARVSRLKKGYGEAELLEIERPSPARIEPPCPLFGLCGGCQLQHLDYAEQLKVKQRRVSDALQRIGGFKEVEVQACIPSPRAYGYRNKIQLPIKRSGSELEIGLYKIRSHEIVDVERCLIHSALGERVYQRAREALKRSSLTAYDEKSHRGFLRHLLVKSAPQSGQALLIFVTNGPGPLPFAKELQHSLPELAGILQNLNPGRHNRILGPDWQLIEGRGYLEEEIQGLRFRISPSAFFQVNPWVASELYAEAIRLAELSPSERVLDAYCGVGTLTLQIAQEAGFVTGIEWEASAVADAEANARLNGLENVRFLCGKVEECLSWQERLDALFLNPPRQGCQKEVLEALLTKRPEKLLYISCNPATLARDLKVLVPKGYKIERVQPFDMFPQTMKVETLVKLQAVP